MYGFDKVDDGSRAGSQLLSYMIKKMMNFRPAMAGPFKGAIDQTLRLSYCDFYLMASGCGQTDPQQKPHIVDEGRKWCWQPSPVACSSCNSNGNIECKWCAGTGFFILGINVLLRLQGDWFSCQVVRGASYIQIAAFFIRLLKALILEAVKAS
ncbi:hypothetical protein FEM48_Zijuj06G0065000 [Ziziphus jujuba var. spinosa]|uniref:Uncharacterized protein n=1 Tax=Ziziphus jujuba var. spinosa TaxID=714518 RepID=A0A978V7Q1_ZIZJJ|nr:hypothetical protein FEM48_Zijuj06G0065000 [Ziziphus jujuba var. spinosa]